MYYVHVAYSVIKAFDANFYRRGTSKLPDLNCYWSFWIIEVYLYQKERGGWNWSLRLNWSFLVFYQVFLYFFFCFVFRFLGFISPIKQRWIIIPPANEVAGVYSDPYVRPFVRPSVRPSVPPSLYSATPLRPLNRISWNFQELFTTWCHTPPPILNFYPHDFGVSQSKTRTLPLQHMGDPSLIGYSS